MKRILRFFFPEEVDFFTPMKTMFNLIGEGVDVYLGAAERDRLTAEDRDRLVTTLKLIEVAGDEIVRKTANDLKQTFTPPFSQMEIRRLFESLDNMIDRLDESAKIIINAEYREGFPVFIAEQLSIFKKGFEEASKAVELLKDARENAEQLGAISTRVGQIETTGDKIYWPKKKELSACINLASKENNLFDYRRAVMDERMLDQMEKLIDNLVDLMNVVEDMVIEHA